VILLQQRYDSPDPARQAELEAARAANASCPAFRHVEAVDGAARRWTFADLFALAAERFSGAVCVIANSDISFDAGIESLRRMVRPGVLVALTRWDDETAPSMEGRVDPTTWRFYSQSQDAWAFIAGGLPAFPADFRLGMPRCENRLAYEAAAAGVVVFDPALSIRTRHHHATNVRTWTRRDGYDGPLFFPRLTTTECTAAEGVVLDRTRGKREFVAVLTGNATDLAEAARRARENRGTNRVRIGLRSPFYLRRLG
jgi:hypothetical protein